jgi:hypothetical protein
MVASAVVGTDRGRAEVALPSLGAAASAHPRQLPLRPPSTGSQAAATNLARAAIHSSPGSAHILQDRRARRTLRRRERFISRRESSFCPLISPRSPIRMYIIPTASCTPVGLRDDRRHHSRVALRERLQRPRRGTHRPRKTRGQCAHRSASRRCIWRVGCDGPRRQGEMCLPLAGAIMSGLDR